MRYAAKFCFQQMLVHAHDFIIKTQVQTCKYPKRTFVACGLQDLLWAASVYVVPPMSE